MTTTPDGTMMGGHSIPRSAVGFRQAVDDRLKILAKELDARVTSSLLRRSLHERFLARGTARSGIAIGHLGVRLYWPWHCRPSSGRRRTGVGDDAIYVHR